MKPFRFDKEHSLYFCTDTIVGWQYVFTSPPFCECIIDSLKYCQKKKGLRLHAFVIMPNHLHTIISSVDANLSNIIRDFKRFTSESITDLVHKADNRRLLEFFAEAARFDKRGNQFKIWQGGSHPEAIETGGFFDQKLRYIHENPVRKGFVKNPEDWLYSSARNYYLHDDSVIKIDCLD
jgi:putative transposase